MIDIIFILLSLSAILSALYMVWVREPIISALSFIVTLLSLAGLFALLSASFIFLVQIIVYAGAIITLLLLIIMFLNIDDDSLPKEPKKLLHMVLSAILVVPLDMALIKAIGTLPKKDMSIISNFGSVKSLGLTLFNGWLLPFELVSILLIVSLIGAIVFAKRKI